MPRSHRLRSRAGAAAAFVAAMVLAPTAALAAQAPATPAAPAAQAPVDVVEVAPTDTATTVPTPTEPAETGTGTGTSVVVGDSPAATPAPAVTPAPAATPALSETPVPASSAPAPSSVVVVPERSDPSIDVFFPVVSPGDSVTVDADGFTPGAGIVIDVDGPAVTESTRFIVHTVDDPFVVDSDGYANFTMDIPADLALGTLTMTVADAEGVSASADIEVRAAVPAPLVTPPTDATAGVVTITGSTGVAGAVAVITVVDADDAEEWDFTPGQDSWTIQQDTVVMSARAAADPWGDVPFDTEPVEWDADFGVSSAVTRVEADGSFSARFVLPAGDYLVSASLAVDPEIPFFSADSEFVSFAVAEAVATPTPGATTPPVVVPAGNTTVVADGAGGSDERRARGVLAYTGAEQGVWIAGAAALLALGTALVAAPRLRRRFGR